MKEEIKEVIKPYKDNYIKEMRKIIGHAPLMTTACGVIDIKATELFRCIAS